MFDILIKGGTVVDPAQKIHGLKDIGITNGVIAEINNDIAENEAKKMVNAKGNIVTPGIIDAHAHVADTVTSLSVPPDELGVYSGITTLCDGGSTGYVNFPAFRRFIISQVRTDIFCCLHIVSIGMEVMPEPLDTYLINPEATLKVIEENRDLIKGIKIRANGALIEKPGGFDLYNTAKKLAKDAKIPLVVHIGLDAGEKTPEEAVDAFTRKAIDLLDRGDILDHPFTSKTGAVVKPNGLIAPELKEAIHRGVALDVAHAASNFRFDLAKICLEQGILPTILSTDTSVNTFHKRAVLSVLVTMSKFMALGLSLDQVIEMTTINPARILKEEHRRGSLKIGLPADVSILELVEGEFHFFDTLEEKKPLKGTKLLKPVRVLKNGVEIPAMSRFK
jgi:dihydroorotase